MMSFVKRWIILYMNKTTETQRDLNEHDVIYSLNFKQVF